MVVYEKIAWKLVLGIKLLFLFIYLYFRNRGMGILKIKRKLDDRENLVFRDGKFWEISEEALSPVLVGLE